MSEAIDAENNPAKNFDGEGPQPGIDSIAKEIIEAFADACKKHDIRIAVAMIQGGEGEPIMYNRGHIFETTKVVNAFANDINDRIDRELGRK